MTATARPEEVLEFWFPDDGHWDDLERHRDFWMTRMQGGMDAAICERFAGITEAAARGLLDQWAETPRGRPALLIALDQFLRSLCPGHQGLPSGARRDRLRRLRQAGTLGEEFLHRRAVPL